MTTGTAQELTASAAGAELANGRSLTEVFRAGVAAHPDDQAVVMVTDPDSPDGARSLTYRQLDAEAQAVAARLRLLCRPGDRALLLYPSGLEFVSAFLGCLYAGVIAVPAPFPSRRQHRQQRLRLTGTAVNAEVAVVLTHLPGRSAVQDWLGDEGLTGVRCEVTGTTGPALSPADGLPREPVFDSGPDTIAFLQYTSGSTGEPKGVILSHRNLLYNIAISGLMGRRRAHRPRMCSWLPLYHDMGLIGTVLSPLVNGGTSVLLDPMTFLRRPYAWLRAMDRYRATSAAAPSFAYALCTRRVTDRELATLDLSSLERLYNGSEKIDPAAMAAFTERFSRAGLAANVFVPSYGLAEATLTVSARADYDPAAHNVDRGRLMGAARPDGRIMVSCGPAPYLDLRIVDPATRQVLAAGSEGEIWLRGPSVSRGYWRREEQTRQTFGAVTADGDGPYLRTGDLGLLRGGQLYISGRIKEVIVVHGQKIFPQDIEQELRSQHQELGGCGAVFAVPAAGEHGPDRIVITHEVNEAAAGHLPELAREIVHTATKEFGATVDSVIFLRPGAVRRTTSGKVKRIEMRDLYTAGKLDPLYSHSR